MDGTMAAEWLLRTLLGGGGLLLLARLWMARLTAPARQQRLGEWALIAALLLSLLSLAPAWLLVPLPAEVTPPLAAVPDSPAESLPPLLAPAEAPPVALEEVPPPVEVFVDLPREEHVVAAGPIAPEVPPDREERTATDSEPLGSPWIAAGLLVYLCGALLLLAHRLLGHLVLWRLLRRSVPPSPAMARLFAVMTAGVRRPRLLLSRQARVPFSCGVLRPTVVLPAGLAETAPPAALRWVFAHELMHLRRRDPWSAALFGLGQAVYFPLPWFWRLRRQVRLCQEHVADAAAAALGRPEDYAQFLLEWTAAPAAPAGVTGVSGNPSDLYRRITMLLQASAPVEPRCPRRWSLPTAAGLLTLAVLVAGVGLAARAAPVPVRKDQPKKDEAKKDEGKKADAKKEDKKELDDLTAVLEGRLKRMPAGTDPQLLEQMRQQMRRLLSSMPAEELRRMRESMERMEQMRGAFLALPGGGGAGLMPGMMAGRPDGRLGARVEAPGATLAEQLDLPKGQGLVLREVLPDSAAAKAGLKPHDILLELNGKPVPDRTEGLVKLMGDIKADATVEAVVLRRGKKETIKELKLPEAKAPAGVFGLVPGAPAGFVPPGGVLPQALPGGAGGFPPAGAGRGVMMTLFRTQDRFTLRHQEGSLVITLTGKTTDGKAKVHDIQIQDAGRSNSYDSADKVPEAYRDKVKNLIEMSEKSSARVEIKEP